MWVYSLDVVIFGLGYQKVYDWMLIAALEMPGQMLLAYITVYWILPNHFKNPNYFRTIALFLFFFFINGLIGHLFFVYYPAYDEDFGVFNFSRIMLMGFYCSLKSFLFVAFCLLKKWYENEKTLSDMEKNKVESELKMLKDQVNPHFMFNTLNNLYGLIGKDPLEAQKSVLGLSGILHYMLYEATPDVVPLSREIVCIENYIELEKLRYAGNLSIAVNKHSELDKLHIVPLSLFPFVENSFKHGASEAIKDAWVNIDFSVYKNDFVFKIENSKTAKARSSNGGGIGLSNVKRRLELIYKKDHALSIIDGDDTYLVVLKINLSRMQGNKIIQHESEMSYR
jgi:hypothetical protein